MLIVQAEVAGRADQCVRTRGDVITEVGRGLRAAAHGEVVLDAAGGAVIPGLHDHHLHLRAVAAAQDSVNLGLPEVNDPVTFDNQLRQAAAQTSGSDDWLRGIGYHESTAGLLDRYRLDDIVRSRPLRIQHRTGSLWILNSRALAEIDADRHQLPGLERDEVGCLTGRLWRLDEWLGSVIPRRQGDLARVSRDAAAMGITGLTDATPHRDVDDVADFDRIVTSGAIVQRLTLMAPPGLDWPQRSGVQRGPAKLVLDDHDLPEVGELAVTIRMAHAQDCPVAVHCVTAEQLIVLTRALEEAGSYPGDRIEHAAVVPPTLVEEIRALGVMIVTQPAFVLERGDDYLRDVELAEQPWLYPCGSLLERGVPVAGSSDAPYGGLDPWAAMRTAVARRTRAGHVLNEGERVSPAVALGLYLGSARHPDRPRRIARGEPADLCILRTSLAEALCAPDRGLVAATMVAGRVAFEDLNG
jgi:predicted amidohydrolase YtcJ